MFRLPGTNTQHFNLILWRFTFGFIDFEQNKIRHSITSINNLEASPHA
jgi:hypothetical protein